MIKRSYFYTAKARLKNGLIQELDGVISQRSFFPKQEKIHDDLIKGLKKAIPGDEAISIKAFNRI